MNFWSSLVLLICLASKAQVSEDAEVELQYKPPLPSFYMGFEFNQWTCTYNIKRESK